MSEFTFLRGKAYLAIPEFTKHLYNELGLNELDIARLNTHVESYAAFQSAIYGDIVYKEGVEKKVFWKRLELEKPFIAHFNSINEVANLLKDMQRNWAMHPFKCIRRSFLIKEKLPFITEKPRNFPYIIPLKPMGIFTLLDEHTLFASAVTSSPLPLGELHFIEDKINPPSRAYLKLYEALCLMDYYKRESHAKNMVTGGLTGSGGLSGDSVKGKNTCDVTECGIFTKDERKAFDNLNCVDAGACPGGWSWVLDKLGANITSIDRSPLASSLMEKPNIKFIKHDAFTLQPQYFGKVDWVFSDVICYPPRLLEWIHKWLDSGLCEQFICTIKMQGEPDMKSIKEASNIPHSKVVHLSYNKHELTFLHSPFL